MGDDTDDWEHKSAAFPDPTEDAFYDAEEARHMEEGYKEKADTLMMGAAVDISEATPEQQEMYREMAGIYEDLFSLFVEKNLDYGSSFQTAGHVDMELDTGDGPFDDALTANLYKLFTRIQDKNQRFYTQMFCDGQNNVNESIHETASDAMVYWSMIAYLTQE